MTNPEDKENSSGINSPEIEVKGGKLEVTQRAITSGDQAYRIAEKLEDDNSGRNETNAIIWNKYNGGQPFDPVAMKAAGEGHRHNFATGFMSSIVDRITPTPKALIDAARYLTSAYLADPSNPEAAKKTDLMREKVTRAIRRWDEWHTFVTELCQELVLSGAGFAIHLDPYTPWPKFFRLDQAFVPEGTGQHARTVPFLAVKDDKLVHEMVDFIRNKAEAADAGWDIDLTVKVINDALPKGSSDSEETSRTYEDAIREGNYGASYSGATIIQLWHVFGVEPSTKVGEDPKVTHFIVNRKGEHELLFEKEDRFESIIDVATLFTLEPGNGKFYGSKGIGRKLINLHLAIERMRCQFADQLEWAGMKILKTDASKAPQVQMKARAPFMLVTSDADFADESVQVNFEAYLAADAKFSSLAEQIAGAYIPNIMNNEGGRDKTAEEVRTDASREQESKVAFLARFWSQFAELISSIQRKLLDPESTDPIAKALQKELEEEGVSKEEMKEFANVPAAEVIQDLTQVQSAQINAVATIYSNNPNVDQHKLMRRHISALSFPALADEIILDPQGLQANEVEAMRQQILETEAILAGSSIPVSPRDPHDVHLKTLIPDMQKGLQGLVQAPNPEMLDNFNAGISHAEGHVQVWSDLGGNPEEIKPFADAVGQIRQAFEQVAESIAQMAQNGQPVESVEVPSASPEAPAGSPQPTEGQNAPQGSQIDPALLIKMWDSYPDMPDDAKRELERMSGMQPSQVGAVGNSTLPPANAERVDRIASQGAPVSPMIPADPAQQVPPVPQPVMPI